jgi:hypothetical protein
MFSLDLIMDHDLILTKLPLTNALEASQKRFHLELYPRVGTPTWGGHRPRDFV